MRKYEQVYLCPFFEKINNQLIKFKNLRLQIINFEIIENELMYYCIHSFINSDAKIETKVFLVNQNQISKKKWIN
jgi:hypothetical protein